MFRWYVVNTYSGHEKKVQADLEHRRRSMSQEHAIRRIVVPTEQQVETEGRPEGRGREARPARLRARRDGRERRDGVARAQHARRDGIRRHDGGGASHMPVPLSRAEVDRVLHQQAAEAKPKAKIEFVLGQPVKIVSGPLSDFDGEIIEINSEAGKLRCTSRSSSDRCPSSCASTRCASSTERDRGSPRARGRSHHEEEERVGQEGRQDHQAPDPRGPGEPGPAGRPCARPARGQHHGVLQGVQRRRRQAASRAASRRSRSPCSRTAPSRSSRRRRRRPC